MKPDRKKFGLIDFAAVMFLVLMVLLSGFMFWRGIVGLRDGKIEYNRNLAYPIVSRQDQPMRYWSSEAEHFFLGTCALVIAIVGFRALPRRKPSVPPDDRDSRR